MSNKYGIFDLSNKLVGFYGNDNNLYSSNYLKNILLFFNIKIRIQVRY